MASGTSAWNATVPLVSGTNTITVRAADAAGNTGSAAIAVIYRRASPSDLNGDGIVDVLDLQRLTNVVLGAPCTGSCDINGDGKVDVLDLQLLTNIILGVGKTP